MIAAKRSDHNRFGDLENSVFGVEVHGGTDRKSRLVRSVANRQVEATRNAERREQVGKDLLEAERCVTPRAGIDVVTDRYPGAALKAAGRKHLRKVPIDSHHGVVHVLEEADLPAEVDLQWRADQGGEPREAAAGTNVLTQSSSGRGATRNGSASNNAERTPASVYSFACPSFDTPGP